ncbi:MAG: hypothetical protein HY516_04840 [Candidatus Aenigmarchaeota archaeon]|nr:hypothetical protein [Candidatus Aenigmarchaeota archaeon]
MTYYSHNDPGYISLLGRRINRLRDALTDVSDPVLEKRLTYRLNDMVKQAEELERHAHNGGYKRGAGLPV